jgi:hypothetical protein
VTDKSREREREKKERQEPFRQKEDKHQDRGKGQPGGRTEEVSETRPPPTKRDKTR